MRFNITTTTVGIAIGRLWAGPIWRPTYKTAFGDFEVRTLDETVVNESQGQQAYVDYRSRRRQVQCSIPALTEEEAIGNEAGTAKNLQDIAFEVGRGNTVIVIPSEGLNQLVHKAGLYGRFVEAPGFVLLDRNTDGRLYSTTFDVIEEL